ncbi:vesicle-associated membrane protein [Trifolium repens]|nr:vesicle-associated membrane protein [Trifolium repens]
MNFKFQHQIQIHKKKKEHNYLRHFTFETINPISIRITREILHLLTQNPRKLIIHTISLSIKNSASISPNKSLMNLFQKRKRNPPSGGIIRHTKNSKSIGPFNMKDVPIL